MDRDKLIQQAIDRYHALVTKAEAAYDAHRITGEQYDARMGRAARDYSAVTMRIIRSREA